MDAFNCIASRGWIRNPIPLVVLSAFVVSASFAQTSVSAWGTYNAGAGANVATGQFPVSGFFTNPVSIPAADSLTNTYSLMGPQGSTFSTINSAASAGAGYFKLYNQVRAEIDSLYIYGPENEVATQHAYGNSYVYLNYSDQLSVRSAGGNLDGTVGTAQLVFRGQGSQEISASPLGDSTWASKLQLNLSFGSSAATYVDLNSSYQPDESFPADNIFTVQTSFVLGNSISMSAFAISSVLARLQSTSTGLLEVTQSFGDSFYFEGITFTDLSGNSIDVAVTSSSGTDYNRSYFPSTPPTSVPDAGSSLTMVFLGSALALGLKRRPWRRAALRV